MRGVGMAKRGPKRELDLELQYWELLRLGLWTVEACRRVGVTRKTGYRWRAESLERLGGGASCRESVAKVI